MQFRMLFEFHPDSRVDMYSDLNVYLNRRLASQLRAPTCPWACIQASESIPISACAGAWSSFRLVCWRANGLSAVVYLLIVRSAPRLFQNFGRSTPRETEKQLLRSNSNGCAEGPLATPWLRNRFAGSARQRRNENHHKDAEDPRCRYSAGCKYYFC